MYNFYEIRNKATHRIEFMGLFAADQKPDEVFKADPASKVFAGRLDLYINIDANSFEEEEQAIVYLHQKRMDYKLPALDLFTEPAPKVSKPRKPKTK